MLTRTRLGVLVSAALDEAKTGTTYNALLALVGDANREWLYGWLNAQRRCRPPVLVQRADGSYIRPQYLVRVPKPEGLPAVVELPPRKSRAELARMARDARSQHAAQRYAFLLRLRREGKSFREIGEAMGITESSVRVMALRARRWEVESRE